MRNRRRSFVLLIVMAAVINLPIAHGAWTQWRIERAGIEMVAAVTDDFVIAPEGEARYVLEFTYDVEFDPRRRGWTVPVDGPTYDRALEDEVLTVRALRDDPSAYSVEGQVSSPVGLVLALFADLVLLGIGLLVWRTPSLSPDRTDLHLIALDDVTRTTPGAGVKRVADETFVVSGDIYAITDDAVVLDLGDRKVHVLLDGFANPVGYQQPAQVTARTVTEAERS